MRTRMHKEASALIFRRAQELREKETNAEKMLWELLKTKPLGRKFRRQHPYSNYILDFYCHSLKLVIEVDGPVHDLEHIRLNDKKRQEDLEVDGLVVVRFTNDQVENNFEKIKGQIFSILEKLNNESTK